MEEGLTPQTMEMEEMVEIVAFMMGGMTHPIVEKEKVVSMVLEMMVFMEVGLTLQTMEKEGVASMTMEVVASMVVEQIPQLIKYNSCTQGFKLSYSSHVKGCS